MLEWLFSAGESNLWLFLGIMIIGLGTELIPAEVGLPLLGLYVSNGTVSWTIAVLVGFLGSLMGATVFYLLGRYAGRPILIRYGKWLLIKEKEIEQGERIVGKYGTWSALFGRFFPVVRSVVSIPCGLFGLSFKRYLLASSIGLFPVSFFYIWVGERFGVKRAESMLKGLEQELWWILGGIVVILGGYILYRRSKAKQHGQTQDVKTKQQNK
ncbi:MULTISPECIES: DedA family protein [unclassified Exiguobacterium]|uniref:DedA family protein n=1 Tax=unclassified Exiguobacterium TaxID=2644629 RepID=UPI0025B9D54F|nr:MULTISPECIES: DedA family protein [unclassified Exiguobacterium]